MQALLLATGETPKLHPLTADTPAPLLPVANRPVLGHAVELLARQGFKSCVVSLHHHAGQVEAFLQDGARWGLRLDYALQREPLGDAGALKWAAPQLAETTLLLPGDALLDLDVAPAAQFHRVHSGLLTALVYAPPAPPAHPVWLAPDGRLSLTPLAGPPLALTGAYLVEPALLDAIPPHAPCGLAADLIPRLLETVTTVHAYQVHGYVNPLATFADYHAAQAAYLDSAAAGTGGGPAATGGGPAIHTLPAGGSALRHPTLDGRHMGSGVWVGKQNVIHPSVRIRPPVCIGDNCRIGRDVELGPHAVVGSHSVIADEATVHASTILPGTYVGRLVDVNGRIVHHNTLIDAATADSTVVADAFLLGPASAQAAGIDLGRVVDAAAAALLLAALAPLLLLAGLAALLANGRLFTDTPVVAARRGSPTPRTFALRRFAAAPGSRLARSGLHRLPELWHVLRGDLALVGVRPLPPAEAAALTEEWQQQRYGRPAGFTGPWFVQPDAHTSPEAALMADTYYVATRTWQTDLRLAARTPLAWVNHLHTPAPVSLPLEGEGQGGGAPAPTQPAKSA